MATLPFTTRDFHPIDHAPLDAQQKTPWFPRGLNFKTTSKSLKINSDY